MGRRCGGTGIHMTLKMSRPYGIAGSTPASGTSGP
jgi:hypothetical protein